MTTLKNYYIIDNNGNLSGSNSNLTTTALWIVENSKLKNLETGNYLLYNTNNWWSPYSLTSNLNNATSIGQQGGHWYIGNTKNNNGNGNGNNNNNNYTYYRPSYSANSWNSSVSSESQTSNLSSFSTKAIKITTKNFEASRTTEGGSLDYGKETTKVNEGTLSFSIPYTGGSCDLSNIVEVVKTIPYTQVGGTTTIVYDAYYVSSNESIEIL